MYLKLCLIIGFLFGQQKFDLNELENGTIPDEPAPEVAINYWNLPLHSTLKDVVRVIRDDEAGHRDVNHNFANVIDNRINSKKYNEVKIKVSNEENLSEKERTFNNK